MHEWNSTLILIFSLKHCYSFFIMLSKIGLHHSCPRNLILEKFCTLQPDLVAQTTNFVKNEKLVTGSLHNGIFG